jgi:hypothetical protein
MLGGHIAAGDRAAISAVTLAAGQERFIVHNDAHERKRQISVTNLLTVCYCTRRWKSSIHPVPGTTTRRWKEEANWLGPALLVSEEAAMHIAA